MDTNFERFMKQNKVEDKKEYKFAPTESLKDENGKPLEWIFKKIKLEEYNKLKEAFSETKLVGQGKKSMYLPQLKSDDFNAQLIINSCIYPDMNNAKLQDSYGVKDAKELLYQLIDNPGEYSNLVLFIQEMYGFTAFKDMVEEAKN